MTTTVTTYHYERTDNQVWLVVDQPSTFGRSEQTARYDSRVLVQPGRYLMRPVTIGHADSTYDDAYYFAVAMTGTLHSGGYADEKPGDIKDVYHQPYGYIVRGALG